MNLFIPLVAVTELFCALFFAGLFIRKRRSLLGYFIGLIPIYIPWQMYILQIPSAEYCRQNLMRCEGTEISVILITGATILMAIVYSALVVSIVASFRHANSRNISVQSAKERMTFAQITIIILVSISILGGSLGFGAVSLINRGAFVAWKNFGNLAESGLTHRFDGEKIQDIHSFDFQGIQVKTNESRIFEADFETCFGNSLPKQENCWRVANETNLPTVGVTDCRLSFWVGSPPGKVIEQVQAKNCSNMQTIQTDYVLLENGDVWGWHYETYDDPFTSGFGVILGTVLGLVVGSIVVLLLSRVNRTHSA